MTKDAPLNIDQNSETKHISADLGIEQYHITNSIIVFRPNRLLMAKICKNAILTSRFWPRVGDLNVHESGPDEDDDGVPDVTVPACCQCPLPQKNIK
jgi:hypothetical protein